MAVGPEGEIVVSWIDSREGQEEGPDIRVAVSRDGGMSFGASRIVDRDACPCCRTDLAVGPRGEIYVAWRKVFEGSVRDIVVARSADGGGHWEEPVRVHADGWVFEGCPHAGPGVAVDAGGTLHVAWYTGREGGAGVYYARSVDAGRTFSDAVALLDGAWVPPSQVDLLAAGSRLWATWEARGAGDPSILVTAVAEGEMPAGSLAARETGTNPALGGSETRQVVAWLDGEAVRAAVGGP
jgi:hypothetical protein